MTTSSPHNPYGVFVPRGRESLPGPVGRPRDDHPLVPWEDENHAGQWVEVDHAREQLENFEQCLSRLSELVNSGVDQGRLVVVTGPAGMGKTTLIHQCVHRARQYIDQLSADEESDRLPLHIVAMTAGYGNDGRGISTDENGEFASTPVINANIRDKIVATLRAHFSHLELDAAISQETPFKAFSAISTVLAQQDALLFVVVPHIDWKDAAVRTRFLKTCLSHAQSRIVLFVEVTHGNVDTSHEVVRELLPSPAVTHLALGGLRSEDTAKFGRSARSDHPDPDDAVLAEWQPTDVRELRQVYHAAAEERIRAGRPVRVTALELRRHAEFRNRLDLPSLSRTAPGRPGQGHQAGPSPQSGSPAVPHQPTAPANPPVPAHHFTPPQQPGPTVDS